MPDWLVALLIGSSGGGLGGYLIRVPRLGLSRPKWRRESRVERWGWGTWRGSGRRDRRLVVGRDAVGSQHFRGASTARLGGSAGSRATGGWDLDRRPRGKGGHGGCLTRRIVPLK